MGNFDNPLILAIETSGRLGSVALAQGDKLLAESHFSGPTRPGVGAAETKEVIDTPTISSAIEGLKMPGRSQMRHSSEIFPAIVGLLNQFGKKPNQIEHVYISVGPGSFTGLRIAVTLAKTLALARGAKSAIGPADGETSPFGGIVAVDTLDCIAANVIGFTAEVAENAEKMKVSTEGRLYSVISHPSSEFLGVILDAKRGQFFIAVYEQSEQPPVSFPRTRPELVEGKRESSIDYPLYATRYPLKKVLPDCLMTAEEFINRFTSQPISLIGEGLVYYKDKFAHKNIRVLDEKFWNPSAANVHKLGWELAKNGRFADPLTLIPNYIRGPDATIKQI